MGRTGTGCSSRSPRSDSTPFMSETLCVWVCVSQYLSCFLSQQSSSVQLFFTSGFCDRRRWSSSSEPLSSASSGTSGPTAATQCRGGNGMKGIQEWNGNSQDAYVEGAEWEEPTGENWTRGTARSRYSWRETIRSGLGTVTGASEELNCQVSDRFLDLVLRQKIILKKWTFQNHDHFSCFSTAGTHQPLTLTSDFPSTWTCGPEVAPQHFTNWEGLNVRHWKGSALLT